MKILLLTDIPPAQNYTGALVLERLIKFLPEGTISAFVVQPPNLHVEPSPEVSWMPMAYATKPRERVPGFPSRALRTAYSLALDTVNTQVRLRSLVRIIADYGQAQGAEVVWCVLQGPTMIRLSYRVAEALGVPLLTLVADPPDWWLTSNRIDRYSQMKIFREYDIALSKSTCCGAASWAMAEEYHARYGIRTIPLIPSLDQRLAIEPASALHSADQFVIGMAGQIYATKEWEALLNALQQADWNLLGREVKIRLLGPHVVTTQGKMNLEFLGWRPQDETIRLLSGVDVNYCPYRFSPAMRAEARLCFPSKLTTYLAAGRPVLFHGPDYSSPARFLEQHQAGIGCYSMEPDAILAALRRFIEEPDQYAELARNGRAAFDAHLTLEHYRRNFAEFLGVEESDLRAIY